MRATDTATAVNNILKPLHTRMNRQDEFSKHTKMRELLMIRYSSLFQTTADLKEVTADIRIPKNIFSSVQEEKESKNHKFKI